jgi:hypothetical protein
LLHVLALAAFSAAAETARPLPLDGIDLSHARRLDGRPVVVFFVVAKPNDYDRGRTIVGAADHPDGSERFAVLRGLRVDVEEGKRVVVAGTLRVTDWPPDFVDGRLVGRWTEVRIVEGK